MVERCSNSRSSATMSTDNIANIVRRVVGAIGNLPESASASSSGSSPGPSCLNAQHELADRFRIPRSAGASSGTVLLRGRSSGCFVPYTKGKGKGKGKSENEIVMKDVCLLPYPQ